MTDRPKVKICGLTSVADAELAVALGADCIGLNFYRRSPRYVDIGRAREIRDAVAGDVEVFGVFVGHENGEVGEIAEAVGLDRLQFHGDESPDQVKPWGDRAVKVWRRLDGLEVADFDAFAGAWGFLCDAFDPVLYGGSGRSWNYEAVLSLPTSKPVFVAGGLGPENIGDALGRLPVWGFDVCSGVESAPGRKDPQKMRRLFEEMSNA